MFLEVVLVAFVPFGLWWNGTEYSSWFVGVFVAYLLLLLIEVNNRNLSLGTFMARAFVPLTIVGLGELTTILIGRLILDPLVWDWIGWYSYNSLWISHLFHGLAWAVLIWLLLRSVSYVILAWSFKHRGVEDAYHKSVDELVMEVLNVSRQEERQPLMFPLQDGDELEVVTHPSRWAIVYPLMLKSSIKWFGIGAMIGFILEFGGWFIRLLFFTDYRLGTPELDFSFVPFSMATTLFTIFVLQTTWYWREWERLNEFIQMWSRQMVIVRQPLFGAVHISSGPMTSVREVRVSAPGEKPGANNPNWFGRRWDWVLNKFFNVGLVSFPVREVGGGDLADNVLLGLYQAALRIAQKARELEKVLGAFDSNILSPEMKFIKSQDQQDLDDAELYRRVKDERYTKARWVNLWDYMVDPGKYDLETGLPIDHGPITPDRPPLNTAAFETAE